jgi:hypothetical protein
MNPWHKIRSALDFSCKTPLFRVTLGFLPYVVGDVGGETRQEQLALGAAPEDVHAYRERRRLCSAVPRVS